MLPIILPGGIILDPNNSTAQQLQAHAEHLGLDDVQVFRATVIGQRHTYLVLDRLRPIFENLTPGAVTAYLNEMSKKQKIQQTMGRSRSCLSSKPNEPSITGEL